LRIGKNKNIMESFKDLESRSQKEEKPNALPEALPSKDDLVILFEEKKKFSENADGKKNEENNFPIAEGEVFYPETDVGEILKAPKKERPQKLKEFKEKLAFQMEGLAGLQEEIIVAINKDPDAPIEDFFLKILQVGSKFGMNSEQKKFAAHILLEYEKKHKKIKEVRRRYPNDKDLFNAVFGRPSEGEVEVHEGPVTFYFRCQNFDDYTFIYSQKFLKKEEVSSIDKSVAGFSRGVSIKTSLIPGLEGSIIAENSGKFGYRFKKFSDFKRTHAHEKEHAFQNIFEAVDLKRFVSEKFIERSFRINLKEAQTDEKKERIVKKFLRQRRAGAENRAKNEIFSFFKGGGWTPEQILKILTDPRGSYNYLADDKLMMKLWFSDKVYGCYVGEFAPAAVDKVYGDEYKQLLKDAIGSFERLMNKGYSKDKAIALLIYKPLSSWGKTVSRVLKERS